jgi:hypothetical protein
MALTLYSFCKVFTLLLTTVIKNWCLFINYLSIYCLLNCFKKKIDRTEAPLFIYLNGKQTKGSTMKVAKVFLINRLAIHIVKIGFIFSV